MLQTSTKVVARPMPSAFSTEVVTASVGHIPSSRRKMGFSFQSPRAKVLPRLMAISAPPLLVSAAAPRGAPSTCGAVRVVAGAETGADAPARARPVTVAPVIASTSPPSFFTRQSRVCRPWPA